MLSFNKNFSLLCWLRHVYVKDLWAAMSSNRPLSCSVQLECDSASFGTAKARLSLTQIKQTCCNLR